MHYIMCSINGIRTTYNNLIESEHFSRTKNQIKSSDVHDSLNKDKNL